MERRKVFHTFVLCSCRLCNNMLVESICRLRSIVTDAMVPQECQDLEEELGIEYDTPEHDSLESSPLCKLPAKARR